MGDSVGIGDLSVFDSSLLPTLFNFDGAAVWVGRADTEGLVVG